VPPANSVTELRPGQSSAPAAPDVVAYDFRHPNKISREHTRILQHACDTFARRLTTLLTSGLRQICRVDVREVTQCSYDEYIAELPVPTLIMPVALPPLPGAGTLHMSLPVALVAIDHMLGGPGGHQEARPLTDIELGLFGGLLDQILGVLRYALEPIVSVTPSHGAFEYNPQFLQAAGPSDPVVVGDFDLEIGAESCRLSISLPFAGLAPRLDSLRPRETNTRAADSAGIIRETLSDVPVEVTVAFRPLALDSGRVLTLDPGEVIVLGHTVGAPLDVEVGGIRVASAVAGKAGNKLAALIVEDASSVPAPLGAIPAPRLPRSNPT
jgi:flagellar motor switch protein FliM